MNLVYPTALKTLRLFFFILYEAQELFPFPKKCKHVLGPTKLQCFCFAPGLKRSGHEIHLWPPSSAEVKNEWSYTSSPHTFMAWTEATLPVIYAFEFRVNTWFSHCDQKFIYFFVFSLPYTCTSETNFSYARWIIRLILRFGKGLEGKGIGVRIRTDTIGYLIRLGTAS